MEAAAADEIVNRIRQDMRHAMKNGSRVVLGELRSLLARISNAEAVATDANTTNNTDRTAGTTAGVGSSEVPRKILSSADIQSIIMAEKHEIEATLATLDDESDYAAELREKLAAVQRYL